MERLCSRTNLTGELWACIAPLLANYTSPFTVLNDDDAWVEPLLRLHSLERSKSSNYEPEGGGENLRVGIVAAGPNPDWSPEKLARYNAAGLIPLTWHHPVSWSKLSERGVPSDFGAHNKQGRLLSWRLCRSGKVPDLGCMPSYTVGYFWVLEADLLPWPLQEKPNATLLKSLKEYDVLVFFERERRMLLNLPQVPGQLRLWMDVEPFPYGDSSDWRHRNFNSFTPARLEEHNICPVALDPFLLGLQFQQTMPFWFRYPVAAWRLAHRSIVRRARQNSIDENQRFLCVRADEFAKPLEELLGPYGWKIITEPTVAYRDLVAQLAMCRFIVYWSSAHFRSAGRLMVEASLLGVPAFGRRDKLFTRLLMPSFFSVKSAAEVARKIRFLEKEPWLERRFRAQVRLRTRFLDSAWAPGPKSIAAAVEMISQGHPFCKMNPAQRRAWAAEEEIEMAHSPDIQVVAPEVFINAWSTSAFQNFLAQRGYATVEPSTHSFNEIGRLCADPTNVERIEQGAGAAVYLKNNWPDVHVTSLFVYVCFEALARRVGYYIVSHDSWAGDLDLRHELLQVAASALDNFILFGSAPYTEYETLRHHGPLWANSLRVQLQKLHIWKSWSP